MPGIDINRFVDLSEKQSSAVICIICLNVFDNAVNSECRHSFCRQCVQQWIDTNHKECPKCKEVFTPRKRSHRSQSGVDLILIGNYVFRHDFTANTIISESKIKCSFDYNGCPEVIEFGSLDSHLKVCEHRICKTCEFPAQPIDLHNCAQLMKNGIQELKSKYEKSEQIVKDLTKELENQCKDMTQLDLKFKSSEKTVKGLTQELKKETKKKTELDLKLKSIQKRVNQLKDRILDFEKDNEMKKKVKKCLERRHYIRFGTLKTVFTNFEYNTQSIGISNVLINGFDYNITIDFIELEEIKYSSNPLLPFLLIKPKSNSCLQIQESLSLKISSSDGLKFDANSENDDEKYIFIVLKTCCEDYCVKAIVEKCQNINPNTKCEEIDV